MRTSLLECGLCKNGHAMSRLIHLLLVFILAMVSAAPALAQPPTLLAPILLSAAETKGTVATLDADGVQRIRIVGGEYFFKPARVIVRANRPVEFLVSKEAGKLPHNLVIEAPAAGVRVKEDLSTEAKKISFTPTAPGTYPFYCGKKLLFFASHRERGMEGALEVVP
jgi:plastocyanin